MVNSTTTAPELTAEQVQAILVKPLADKRDLGHPPRDVGHPVRQGAAGAAQRVGGGRQGHHQSEDPAPHQHPRDDPAEDEEVTGDLTGTADVRGRIQAHGPSLTDPDGSLVRNTRLVLPRWVGAGLG